jgi:glycerol uptake operon antiterminator
MLEAIMTAGSKKNEAIIAAVSSLDKIDAAIDSPCKTVFLLTGNVFNLQNSIEKIQKAKKKVYVDVDFMDGFGRDTVFLEYLHQVLKPDGIISTKGNLIKKAMSLTLFAVQRIFIFDSMSLQSGIDSVKNIKPDAVEILPGIMPRIIKKVREATKLPIISGGLISDREDVDAALEAGAIGISTGNTKLWNSY